MSRRGSTDSSAANGSSSIARYSHTANGKAARTPCSPERTGPERRRAPVHQRRCPMPSGDVDMRNGRAQTAKNRKRYERDARVTLNEKRDAADVQRETGHSRDPPAPIRQAGIEHAAEIGPDEEADDSRGRTYSTLSQTPDRKPPIPIASREDVGGARIGKSRTHLRDAKDEAKKHERHDRGGCQQTAPSGDCEPIVPTGEMLDIARRRPAPTDQMPA